MTTRTRTPSALQHESLVSQWDEAKQRLAIAKSEEYRLRSLLVAVLFDPTKREGTETVDTTFGKLKAIKSQSYSFASADAARTMMLTLAAEFGQEGLFVSNRLIVWKPELIVREWRQLRSDMRDSIQRNVVIKEAATQLSLAP